MILRRVQVFMVVDLHAQRASRRGQPSDGTLTLPWRRRHDHHQPGPLLPSERVIELGEKTSGGQDFQVCERNPHHLDGDKRLDQTPSRRSKQTCASRVCTHRELC